MVADVRGELARFVHAALLDPADEAPDPPGRTTRRRVVTAITLVAGGVLLAWALRRPPGSPSFYWGSAAVALLWVVGARASGPIALGRGRRRRSEQASFAIVQSLLLGGALLGLFLVGALGVAGIPALREPVDQLLQHSQGALLLVALITATSGAAEEYFFRGALFRALPRRGQVLGSALVYGVVTAGAGIALLVLAAVMLGLLTGLQRRATGGFLGPVVTHLTWSLGMLFLLPSALHAGEQLWG